MFSAPRGEFGGWALALWSTSPRLRDSLTDASSRVVLSNRVWCLRPNAEGPMSVDPPLEATEVRFISSGRILKDCEQVQGTVWSFILYLSVSALYTLYQTPWCTCCADLVGAYGGAQDDDEDFILTLHAVVRPPKPPKKSSKKGKSGHGNASPARSGAVASSAGSSGQCCTIC